MTDGMDVDTALDTLAKAAGAELDRFMGQPRPGDQRISRSAVRKAALTVAGDQPLKGIDVTREEDVERMADQALGHFMILWWLGEGHTYPSKTLRGWRARRRIVRHIEEMSGEPERDWSRYAED